MRLLIFLCFFIGSCAGESIPKDIIPPAKIEAIWYDAIRADEMVDVYSIQDSTYRNFSKRSALYDSIFHIHSISKESFEKSMEFYEGRPDLLKTILESLQKKIDTVVVDTAVIKDTVMRKKVIRELAK